MKNKIISGLSILALVIGGYLFLLSRETPQEAKAGTLIRSADVLGTGTSTTATYKFTATQSTTTSNVIVAGNGIDIVDLMIYPIYASSTAHLSFEILTSSVPRCAQVTGTNVGWVDALSPVTNPTAPLTNTIITTGSSTVGFAPRTNVAEGKRFQITNFNANCMKLFVGGKDVNVYIQANLKTLSF